MILNTLHHSSSFNQYSLGFWVNYGCFWFMPLTGFFSIATTADGSWVLQYLQPSAVPHLPGKTWFLRNKVKIIQTVTTTDNIIALSLRFLCFCFEEHWRYQWNLKCYSLEINTAPPTSQPYDVYYCLEIKSTN